MTVTIMFRNTYTGGDGWQYYPVTLEIADVCPKCGGRRGEEKRVPQCEDGEWFWLSQWSNPCGHVDAYRDVWHEAIATLASA